MLACPPSTLTVVLATRNAGKVRELREPLAAFGLAVKGLDDPELPLVSEVEETGLTFAANAQLKAHAVALATGCMALADDSGLAVDALDGAPGVYSARYCQPADASLLPDVAHLLSQDERNNHKLLHALRHVPDAARSARFCCAMCLARPMPDGAVLELMAYGEWAGCVLHEARGQGGFGYDPLFFDSELELSAAQMPREVKMVRSHRAVALRDLLRRLAAMPDFWKA